MGVGLVVTDANHVDSMMVEDYSLDCAWGKDENDFELTVDKLIPQGAFVYLEESECGGIVDALRDQLERGDSTLTYSGRTWHGMLENKILAPDSGQDYLTVSGNASTILGALLSRVSLTRCSKRSFPVRRRVHQVLPVRTVCGRIHGRLRDGESERFETQSRLPVRPCRNMAGDGRRLRERHRLRPVGLRRIAHVAQAEPHDRLGQGRVEEPHRQPLVCGLERQRHPNPDVQGFGRDCPSVRLFVGEADELAKNTKKKLQDLQSEGEVKVTVHEDSGIVFDVGDTVTARDNLTGITVNATISKKIVKVSGGVMSVDYEAE